MEDITKTIMFTTNNLQGTPTIQYQTIQGDVTLKQPKIEGQKQDFPTFCYVNSNMIQKITPTSQMSTVNLAQLTSDDNKTVQYIAQPLGYNYTLVNPMQIQNGVNTITVDGRQLIMNKPITANTISNISFKCDICGLMFAHLTSLNHHKRTHAQDNDGNLDQQGGGITVVAAQQQGIVQTQNLISETGQNLGQIQIVATETLEPAQTIHQSNDIHIQTQPHTITTTSMKHEKQQQKCVTCGGHIAHTGKRKGPKLIRCESCISSDQTQTRPTQIFIAPDGDIKFEIGEIQTDSSGNVETITTQVVTAPSQAHHQQHQQQHHSNQQQSQTTTVHHQSSSQKLPPGAHPVKKRNTGTVTKCNKCNGSGVIFIGGAKKATQQTQ